MADKENTETFSSETSWTVPDLVDEVVIECWGGNGEDPWIEYNGSDVYDTDIEPGGHGGYVEGTLDVSPGDELYIRFPEGGAGRNSGMISTDFDGESGDGGDGADVRHNSDEADSIVIGAGGGGGGGIGGVVLSDWDGMDVTIGESGNANENGMYLEEWPPDPTFAGEDGLFHAETDDSSEGLDGEWGSGGDRDGSIAITGGGGGGYIGGEASTQDVDDEDDVIYAGGGGAAGGAFNTSGVYNVNTQIDGTISREVRVHWEETMPNFKVSAEGAFERKPVKYSNGDSFVEPEAIYRSDGEGWIEL